MDKYARELKELRDRLRKNGLTEVANDPRALAIAYLASKQSETVVNVV